MNTGKWDVKTNLNIEQGTRNFEHRSV